MADLKNYKNGHGYDCYLINTEGGALQISFEGNLDLYWRLIPKDSIAASSDAITISITKEDYQIYQYFDYLYFNIINKQKNDNLFRFEALDALIQGDVIVWHSDDDVFENSSVLKICPGMEEYLITFEKSKKNYFNAFFVRICNSGSRYAPYNIEFMKMYRELKKYDSDKLQIHMEEILYQQKKLTLIKEEK